MKVKPYRFITFYHRLYSMSLKILGGLSIENLASHLLAITVDFNNAEKLELQHCLYQEGYTSGIQLRVGHDFTNTEPIAEFLSTLDSFGVPFIVHGPAENMGVDLGEALDEEGVFGRYQQKNPEAKWGEFNRTALENATYIASNAPLCLDPHVVIHPGYAGLNVKEDYAHSQGKILKALNGYLRESPLTLETVPALLFNPDNSILTHFAFGGLSEEMIILRERQSPSFPRKVLLDFTHIGVTSNQMSQVPDLFSEVKTYEELIGDFLKLPYLSNFVHFSGHTSKLWDEHKGFLNEEAQDEYKHGVIKEALKELQKRYAQEGKDVYVALEIRFTDLEHSKREIGAFREQYE